MGRITDGIARKPKAFRIRPEVFSAFAERCRTEARVQSYVVERLVDEWAKGGLKGVKIVKAENAERVPHGFRLKEEVFSAFRDKCRNEAFIQSCVIDSLMADWARGKVKL